MTPLAPAVPGAPSYTTGILIVFVSGVIRFDPLTVKDTETPVDELVGVTTTEDAIELVGVAPLIDQLYVGDVTFCRTAERVAEVGVKAPPEF